MIDWEGGKLGDMKPYRRIVFAFALFAAVTLEVQAQQGTRPVDSEPEPKWFTIELVVFEQAGSHDEGAPPPDRREPALADAVELDRVFEQLQGQVPASPPPDPSESAIPLLGAMSGERFPGGYPDFLPVPQQDLALSDAVNRMRKTATYRPLAHMAWRQRAGTFGDARRIRVTGGRVLERREPARRSAETGTDDGAGRTSRPVALPVNVAMAAEPEAVHELDGTATFSEGRFRHLSLELYLREPRRPGPMRMLQGNEGDGMPAWRLNERRRVEAGQLQYFDHHRFGAIALVRPWVSGVAPNDDGASENSGLGDEGD